MTRHEAGTRSLRDWVGGARQPGDLWAPVGGSDGGNQGGRADAVLATAPGSSDRAIFCAAASALWSKYSHHKVTEVTKAR